MPVPNNSSPVLAPVPVVMLAPWFSVIPLALLRTTLPVPLFTVPVTFSPAPSVSFKAKSPWLVKVPRLLIRLFAE